LPLAAAAINQSCDRGEEVNQGLEISLGAIQLALLLGEVQNTVGFTPRGRFKIQLASLLGGGSKYSWLHSGRRSKYSWLHSSGGVSKYSWIHSLGGGSKYSWFHSSVGGSKYSWLHSSGGGSKYSWLHSSG
jgi:hypothetical protein